MLRYDWLTPEGEKAEERGAKASVLSPLYLFPQVLCHWICLSVCLSVHRFVPGGCCETSLKTDRKTVPHAQNTHIHLAVKK